MNRYGDPAALVLFDKLFAALDESDARWLADEYGVERVEFVREAGPHIVVRSKGEEIAVDPRDLYANPHAAQIGHEMLRSNAEARVQSYGGTDE